MGIDRRIDMLEHWLLGCRGATLAQMYRTSPRMLPLRLEEAAAVVADAMRIDAPTLGDIAPLGRRRGEFLEKFYAYRDRLDKFRRNGL